MYRCPQILPLVPRNLQLYFQMPRDIPFQLWIYSRLKGLIIVSTSIVSVSVCTHHIFVSLILCIWFVSSTVYMITKTLQSIFISRPSITDIFAHDIVFIRYTQVYLKLISDMSAGSQLQTRDSRILWGMISYRYSNLRSEILSTRLMFFSS